MKTLDPLALPPEAWRPVETAAGRVFNRVNERELDRIAAWIELIHARDGASAGKFRVKLWDFSHIGFAVLLDPAKTGLAQASPGAKARISIDFGAGPFSADCVIRNASQWKGQIKIGLARLDITRWEGSESDDAGPGEECLALPETMQIKVVVANPVFYGEWSEMRLCAIRSGFKLELQSRDDSLPFFLGQRIEAKLALPTSGDNHYRGEIISISISGDSTVRIGIKPLSLSASLANDLAELLVFELEISPDALKRFGFPTRFFRARIAFRFVENMEDYEKVLILRRNAYVEVGKRDQATVPEDMSIAWDKSSRILCAFHDGVLVASAALTFPNSESVILRSESAFPGNKFPGKPPPKSQLLEINSLCTHKDYRRGDLLHAVFEHIARIFLLSDRKYIMNLSDSTLLPMYLGIGFKAQGVTGQFLGRPHHLIKGSREGITKARGLGLLRWNILYGDLMQDLLVKNMLGLNAWDRAMLRFRLAFKPLANRLHRINGERAFRNMITENRETEK
ncbi:MAG: hypothetical protein ABI036_00885 [Fibrobacteria bacterium]